MFKTLFKAFALRLLFEQFTFFCYIDAILFGIFVYLEENIMSGDEVGDVILGDHLLFWCCADAAAMNEGKEFLTHSVLFFLRMFIKFRICCVKIGVIPLSGSLE